MNDAEFRELVSEATEFLRARIAQACEEFGIGEFERYDYDLPTNRFWWSDAGVPKVEASIVIVGSISTASDTWLWSWPTLTSTTFELRALSAFANLASNTTFRRSQNPNGPQTRPMAGR
jgi:hypothetical protein